MHSFSWLVSGARLTLLLSGLALGPACACNRTEEPVAPSPSSGDAPAMAGSNAGGGNASGGEATAAAGQPASMPSSTACVVPFAAPAPVASKALTCPKDPTGNLKLAIGRVTFVDAPNAPSAEVELARDDASRERGLMYRTSMPEGSGMLFSWPEQRVRSFWMHNTCIPLDLLYITLDGTISGVLEQVPTLNDAPRRIDCPVAHVLELNAGWVRAHGVTPGMKVTIEG